MNARRTLAVLLAVLLAVAAAVAQSPPPTSDDPLFAETLPIDIDTARAAELAAWLRQLGLPDGGDRDARQQRLREHYGLPSPEEASVEDPGSEISVESARSARYRSDELGHTTLVLEGEVVITAVDRDTGARHRIQADRITYHDERNSLTASGSVEYTMTTDDGSEVFRGESLSVDTERWEGIFYDGSSQVDQTVAEQAADQDVTFTYSGKAITRRADDTVVMEQATVTSSDDPDDPRLPDRSGAAVDPGARGVGGQQRVPARRRGAGAVSAVLSPPGRQAVVAPGGRAAQPRGVLPADDDLPDRAQTGR